DIDQTPRSKRAQHKRDRGDFDIYLRAVEFGAHLRFGEAMDAAHRLDLGTIDRQDKIVARGQGQNRILAADARAQKPARAILNDDEWIAPACAPVQRIDETTERGIALAVDDFEAIHAWRSDGRPLRIGIVEDAPRAGAQIDRHDFA